MTAASAATSTSSGYRKCQVVLLDNQTLEFNIQPKTYAGDLLDLVAAGLSLKEKQYFGLYYLDGDISHQNWLLLERRLMEHDLPVVPADGSRQALLKLFFAVRFYAESIRFLQESITVELFYHQARRSIYEGRVECCSETVFELAAHALQEAVGDHSDDLTACKALKRMSVFPAAIVHACSSHEYCEERTLVSYRPLRGQTRGQSIVSYMRRVEALPTYGIHFYEVRDKPGQAWWLGLSCRGITQCDDNDRSSAYRLFPWKQLENLYFRDKKFSIEVHDPKRVIHALSSFNLYEDAIHETVGELDELSDALADPTTQVSVSRRTFGPSNVNVYAWFTSRPQLTKAIWSVAVCQHQFYLDHKQSKLPRARAMGDIAAAIPSIPAPLLAPAAGGSSSSLPVKAADSKLPVVPLQNEEASKKSSVTVLGESPATNGDKATRRRALSCRRDDMRLALEAALFELRDICLHEAVLTGHLPTEYPAVPGEKLPTIPRRVGTAFTLSAVGGTALDEATKKAELQYELQKQITRAVWKLVNDVALSKGIRKKHRITYERARIRLKEMEAEVQKAHAAAGTEISSLSSGFSDELGIDLNGEHEPSSTQSSPCLGQRHPTMLSPSINGIAKVSSLPQVGNADALPSLREKCASPVIVDPLSRQTPPPPLMPRSVSSSSAASLPLRQHHRPRNLSNGTVQSEGEWLPEVSAVRIADRRVPSPQLSVCSQSAEPQSQLLAYSCAAAPPNRQVTVPLPTVCLSPPAHTLPPPVGQALVARTGGAGQPAGGLFGHPSDLAVARPARSGSFDDLYHGEGLATGKAGATHAYGNVPPVSALHLVRNKDMYVNNSYGSLERRKPRASGPSAVAAAATHHDSPLVASPRSVCSGQPPPSPRSTGHSQLVRVRSAPLQQRHLDLSRRHQANHPSEGNQVAREDLVAVTSGAAIAGQHWLLTEQMNSAHNKWPPPPQNATVGPSLVAERGGSALCVGTCQSRALAAGSHAARILAAPPLEYDQYVLRLSKASQRMYEGPTPHLQQQQAAHADYLATGGSSSRSSSRNGSSAPGMEDAMLMSPHVLDSAFGGSSTDSLRTLSARVPAAAAAVGGLQLHATPQARGGGASAELARRQPSPQLDMLHRGYHQANTSLTQRVQWVDVGQRDAYANAPIENGGANTQLYLNTWREEYFTQKTSVMSTTTRLVSSAASAANERDSFPVHFAVGPVDTGSTSRNNTGCTSHTQGNRMWSNPAVANLGHLQVSSLWHDPAVANADAVDMNVASTFV